MSRRWYRHGTQVVFVGWEPSEQGFYINIVDLCEACAGSGEQDGSDEICPDCGGEGVLRNTLHPSNRVGHLNLDQLTAQLGGLGIPFPQFIRSDLEQDQRTNSATALYEYNLDT